MPRANNFGRAALALVCSLCQTGQVAAEEPCKHASIESWPPTQEEWHSALGDEEKEVRFLSSARSGEWSIAYEPQWASAGILGRTRPRLSSDALITFNDHSASETVHIAWSEIVRMDRRRGNYGPEGFAIGVAVGLALAYLIVNSSEGPGLTRGQLALVIAVPAAIGGGIGVSRSRWSPVFCGEQPQGESRTTGAAHASSFRHTAAD
jgi:hypothetical protein